MQTLHGFVAFAILSFRLAEAESIVVPADRATQGGNAQLLDGFEQPGTFQTVYTAANFPQPFIITSISFRTDENRNGLAAQVDIPRLTIQLSTYSGTFALFNQSSYLANAGPDNVVVFDSSIHWASTDLPGSGPNPFDLKIPLARPFFFNPATGSLLMNYDASGSFSSVIVADAHVTDTTVGWFSTGSGKNPGNLVTQFEVMFVPEASNLSLFVFGSAVVLTLRRKL